jgi:DNA methylase
MKRRRLPRPYFERDGIVIYHGDARKILPLLPRRSFDVVLTDPVWPDAEPELRGRGDEVELFRSVAGDMVRLAPRIVVQLGADTDPRFLSPISRKVPFLRTCWLSYTAPHYKGMLLMDADVAYVFGQPPERAGSHGVLPGRCSENSFNRDHKRIRHPCPRSITHVRWLVRWFVQGPVLDPFMGSGSTLVAAHEAGWPAVGVEVEERFCQEAVRRLRQRALPLRAAETEEQPELFSEEPAEA